MAVPMKMGLNLSAMHPNAIVEAARLADSPRLRRRAWRDLAKASRVSS